MLICSYKINYNNVIFSDITQNTNYFLMAAKSILTQHNLNISENYSEHLIHNIYKVNTIQNDESCHFKNLYFQKYQQF